MAKAYVIGEFDIHDIETYQTYKAGTPASIEAHGGRFLVRGGELEVFEGEQTFPRVVILEFPTRAQADAWYHSQTYQALRTIRQSAARGKLIVVDGVE